MNQYSYLLKKPLAELIKQANETRKTFIGPDLDICSIVNAKSGLCNEDCKFCAQSLRHSTNVSTYPLMAKERLIKAAQRAKEIGARRFDIVTSGNRLSAVELDSIIDAVSEIKTKLGIALCASLGALNKDELKRLKQAGISRYHHNIETSQRFYPRIVSAHSFKERINTIRTAKELGFEVCSGGIIGMGETWHDRIDMACTLKELNVDSVPINLLVPIKGTPFEFKELISPNDAIKTISIFRIILKDKTIKIAAGREAILKDSQASAFMAGANGMLIGGYLTIKGQGIEQDHKLIEKIKGLWQK